MKNKHTFENLPLVGNLNAKQIITPDASVDAQPYLFGDPDSGDGDDDFDDIGGDDDSFSYGDMDDGDMEEGDLLDIYADLSGDPGRPKYGDGGSRRGAGFLNKAGRFAAKNKWKIAAGAAGLGGSVLLARAIAKRRARRRALGLVNARQARLSRRNTLRNQRLAKHYRGAIHPNQPIPFVELTGGLLNQAQIDVLATFSAADLTYMVTKQAMETPYYQQTVVGTPAGQLVNLVITPPSSRYYSPIVIHIGTNLLNAAPGTVITVTGDLPLADGTTLPIIDPFVITFQKGFDIRLKLSPWKLVANKVLPVQGMYSPSASINITVTFPSAVQASASSVTGVVLGTLHPSMVALRNMLLAGK